MSKAMATVALAGLLLAATPAAAQTHGRAGDWSVLGGETVAPGGDVVYGAFGWPDTTFGYTHGLSRDFDIGFKLQLLYGVENTTDTHFGMAFAVPLRWTLARQQNVSVLLHVDPGIRFYTTDPVIFGFQLLPFGLNVEFQPLPQLGVGLGFDWNSTLIVSGGATPQYLFGPLVGPFFEYHIDRHVALGLDTRFGAIIDAGDFPGSPFTRFGFRAQMMLAYRM
jgi:hypothetical protein